MSYITPKTNWNANDYLNYDDLNRVENNTQYVYNKLVASGYNPIQPIIKTWVDGEDIFEEDLNRIENNIQQLADVYATSSEWQPPKRNWQVLDTLDYTFSNRIEIDLDILNSLIESMKKYYVHCGVARCGQNRMWQNRFRRY